jgi:class 3 adenylate cyclase/tetratricopeptide (TPR) repeat protein
VAATRRLAAIMFTDLVGSTSAAQTNEAAALLLQQEQEALLRPLFASHQGREIKSIGDGFLVEFDSALHATQCAIEIQQRVHERNARKATSPLELRIGVHLGDVEQRGADIFGDAVNIAARIQPIAEVGGVCLTGAVFEQVRNKIEHPCEELPRVHLKNVQVPVSLYRVDLPWLVGGSAHLTPWMDREHELEVLGRAVRDLLGGVGGLVQVAGEAGIGKTRLIEEVVRRAPGSELRVLRARGLRGESSPPFAFWTEAARDFFREAPAQLVYKVCGSQPSDIIKLVPELAERLGSAPPLPSLDPDQERIRFYEGIVQLFVNISKEFPLIVLFDDLQWADAASLRLLQYAAPRIPRARILLLVAYREPEPGRDDALREVVEDHRRQNYGPTLALKRFGADEVARIVKRLLLSPASTGELSHLIYRKTGGNPFFVEEVVRDLAERAGTASSDASVLPSAEELNVPSTVREAVRQRLHRLSPSTLEVLALTSVIGEEFKLETASAVLRRSDDALLPAIEESLHAGVLTERRSPAGGILLAFSDELIRDALYEELSLLRRERLHLEVARAIESTEGERTPEEIVELERHYLHGNDVEKTRRYAGLAAEHASKLNAPEEVVRHLLVALRTVSESAEPGVRADLLRRLGSEEDRLARSKDALKHFTEAAALYRKEGKARGAGDSLRQASEVHLYQLSSRDHALALLQEARTLLSTVPESVELAEVLAGLAAFFWMGGDLEQCRTLTEETLALGSRLESYVVQAKALRTLGTLVRPSEGAEKSLEYLHQALSLAQRYSITTVEFDTTVDLGVAYGWGTGNVGESLAWMERAIEFGQRTRSPALEMQARGCIIPYTLIAIGEFDRADAEGHRAEEFYQEHRLPLDPRIPLLLGQAALARGDLRAAESRLEEATRLLESYSYFPIATLCYFLRGQLQRELGNRNASLTEFRTAVQTFQTAGTLAWMAGSQAMALEALAATLVDEVEGGEVPEEAWVARSRLSELAGQIRQDVIRAIDLRLQARFARAEKDAVGAATALAESVGIWQRLGWRQEFARTRYALGELWVEQGSMAAASGCLQEAMEVFTQMKAARDIERTRVQLLRTQV